MQSKHQHRWQFLSWMLVIAVVSALAAAIQWSSTPDGTFAWANRLFASFAGLFTAGMLLHFLRRG